MAIKLSIFSVVDHYADGLRDKATLYRELIEQIVLADRLGFDTAWIAEHHFVDYGIVPNPAVLLAHLAARTTRIKLGPAVAVLPFRDPRLLAEDFAMLDQLSGGRAVLGVGSGYVAPEYAGFGLSFADKHQRFNESLAILRSLLAGNRVTYQGEYYQLNEVSLNLPPIARDVPIRIATGRKEAVAEIGRQGDSLMFMAYTLCQRIDETGPVVDLFRCARAQAGHLPTGASVAVGLHTHVGTTDAAARASVLPAFDRYASTRVKAKRRSYDDALDAGVVLFGSPERVAARLIDLHHMGVDEVLTLGNFGLMDSAAVDESMHRLIHEVMPMVNAELGLPASADSPREVQKSTAAASA